MVAVGGILTVALLLSFNQFRRGNPEHVPALAEPTRPTEHRVVGVDNTNRHTLGRRTRAQVAPAEFDDTERRAFQDNFEKKYKPAIQRWAATYQGHVPFDPRAVSAQHCISRVGVNSDYYSYMFLIDGVTLGVEDRNGSVRLDYVGTTGTKKMMMMPTGAQPVLEPPVAKQDIISMVRADLGPIGANDEIRIIPSGLSSALNGGAIVCVGGDPNNFASWKINIVFKPDGQLAYYLLGPH